MRTETSSKERWIIITVYELLDAKGVERRIEVSVNNVMENG